MDTELRAIQAKLVELGFDPGPVDGIWGTETRRAVARQLGITPAAAKKSGTVAAPWLDLARAQLGVKEVAGAGNSNTITGYFQASVQQKHPDSVPWCAAFVGAMLADTGYVGTGSLMARSYLDWGTELTKPVPGAIVIFKRGAAPAGHVAFVDAVTSSSLKCIGGNQSDAVTIASFSRTSVLGYRWPKEAAA